ncbi:DUF262 domain-containing protein [Nocardia sp. NPDC004568]|uniref:DUF262 domain-containing protein n=1 Tax=Nocardia sp. NPDC004568 TaxID=3154551 RepID=UPI0033AEFB38
MQQQALTLPLRTVVQLGQSGRLRVGAHSRAVVWGSEQATKLFDSIYRGYPIGMLVVAEHAAPAEDFELGGLDVHAPEDPAAWTIIDGLQRLSIVIGGWNAEEDSRYQVCFDLEQREFVVGPSHRANMLPVSIAVKDERLRLWLRDRPFIPDEYRSSAFALGSRLANYQVSIFVTKKHSPDSIEADIFVRLNQSGSKLTREDIVRAEDSRKDRYSSERISISSERMGFGKLPQAVIAQCTLATLDPLESVPGEAHALLLYNNLSEDTIVSTEREMRQTLRLTIDFIQHHVHIPHLRLLPEPLSFPVLMRFTRLFGKPEYRTRELLRRWIWRMEGRPSEKMAMSEPARESPTAEAQRLLGTIAVSSIQFSPDLKSVDTNTTPGRVNALALLGAEPPMLSPLEISYNLPATPLTDSNVLIPWLDSHSDVFLPLIPVDSIGLPQLGAYILHPPAPTEVILETIFALDEGSPGLRSHYLSPESVELLRRGDLSEFVSVRNSALTSGIKRRVQQYARRGFRDKGQLPHIDFDKD